MARRSLGEGGAAPDGGGRADPRTVPIADYAVIGDCRTAALVSREGSVDWLCVPDFDSPSIFAALLDPRAGGRFAVRPASPAVVGRRYLGDSNVLETTFRTASGVLRLVDLMPVDDEDARRRSLIPAHQVLRLAECLDGDVEVEVVCDPRPDYARRAAAPVDRGPLGHHFDLGRRALVLRSEVPVAPDPEGPGLRGRERLRAGERRWVSLSCDAQEPAVIPALGGEAADALEGSLRWWHRWAARCRYDGAHRAAVVRSALAVKLMTYAPSGAVVAAPTASLPEWPGGARNWDYRYCWLRDASLTLRALMDLGFEEEGSAFMGWLLHATRLSHPELQVVYDVRGETRLRERELPHLAGYAGSRPVRVGNDASGQVQLDTYGEVLDAAFQYVARGGALDRGTRRLLRGLGRTIRRLWREPDHGIWERRDGPRRHTHSPAMCWVGLDRLIRLGERAGVPVDADAVRRDMKAIRDEVESRGYDEGTGSYLRELGGSEVDASLLLLALYGYADPGSERMRRTCDRVYARLGTGSFLRRYEGGDGMDGPEGAFGIAGFWGVECLARGGRVAEAARHMDVLCASASDVGLFGEEIDPATGAQLGNFPQAFTHVGLISAALALADAEEGGGRERR